jgi:hypothetical protein
LTNWSEYRENVGKDQLTMRKAQVPKTVELTLKAKSQVAPPSPGWDEAVSSATARLNEGWVLPETECHPAVAEELAAFLCAYGA